MEKNTSGMMKDFGGRVASVWEGLRPMTRNLVETALAAAIAPSGQSTAGRMPSAGAPYDARSEWELSRLLAALDERGRESAGLDALNDEQARALMHMAEACARVLHGEARSAEVFAQLLERTLSTGNYRRVDALADTISSRLAPSEMCELARHDSPSVRAIALEALAQVPTGILVELLGDPVDADVARAALESQADEYGSAEARWVVNALERADEEEGLD
ncbi:MAG: hypothetical protein ACRD9R_06280 [Pyrinomonadaceae bacterium]